MKRIALLGLVSALVACGGGRGNGDGTGSGDNSNGIGSGNGNPTDHPGSSDGTVTFDVFTKVSGVTAIGDINGDGVVDLFTADGAQAWSVRLADGHGAFGSPIVDPKGRTAKVIGFADLNGDKRKDALIREDNTHVGLALGGTDGTFAAPIHIAILAGDNNQTADVELRDTDHDGTMEILEGSGISWYRITVAQDGTPSAPSKSLPYYTFDGPVYLCDFDNDGQLDRLSVDSGLHVVVKNVTLLDLSPGKNVGHDVLSASCGDVDGNGQADVVVVRADTTGNMDTTAEFRHPAEVDVFRGFGDGTFDTADRFAVDADLNEYVDTVDVAGIGRAQITVSTKATNETRLITITGQAATQQKLPSRWGTKATTEFYDLNGDKKMDMMVHSGNDYFFGLQK